MLINYLHNYFLSYFTFPFIVSLFLSLSLAAIRRNIRLLVHEDAISTVINLARSEKSIVWIN